MRLIDADKLHSDFMKMAEFKPNSEIGEPTCGCTRRLVFHISEGIRKINEQPTVDAEPIRHGHWEKIETSKAYDCQNTMPIYKCSFCHTPFVNVDLKDRYHYCPNCGAKMEEEEEMDIKKYCIPKEEYNIPLVNEGIQEGRKLVRCKDCKYWAEAGREYNPNTNSWSAVMVCDYDECPEGCGHTCWSTDADDFCSRGKRKDD